MSRAWTYMGRWRITPAMTAMTPAWNSPRCPYMLTGSGNRRRGTRLAEVEPLRDGSDERQRHEWRRGVEGDRQRPPAVGGDADQRFHHRHEDRDHDLLPPPAHDRARIGDHEEDEQ